MTDDETIARIPRDHLSRARIVARSAWATVTDREDAAAILLQSHSLADRELGRRTLIGAWTGRETTPPAIRLRHWVILFGALVAGSAVGLVLGHTITKAIANAALLAAGGAP